MDNTVNNASNNNNTNSYKNVSGKPNPFLVTTVKEIKKGIKDMRINGANVIIDGKVYINRGDKVFTLQGQEVK